MTDCEKLKEIRRIISIREKCTQAKFAKIIGTTLGMVGKMEAGIRPVTWNFKKKIKEATGAELLNDFDYPVALDEETGKYERFELEHYLESKLILEFRKEPNKELNFSVAALKELYFAAKTKGTLSDVFLSFNDWAKNEADKLGD